MAGGGGICVASLEVPRRIMEKAMTVMFSLQSRKFQVPNAAGVPKGTRAMSTSASAHSAAARRINVAEGCVCASIACRVMSAAAALAD